MARGRWAWIRAEARRALVLTGARRPDQIDPIKTAKLYECQVTYGKIKGSTEQITMLGKYARVRISSSIVQPGRRNFTTVHGVAHKALGHKIPKHDDPEEWIKYSCGRRGAPDERECDVFATEHLTPEPWVRPYCTVPRFDLDAVHTIAKVFPVSCVTAAVRFTELTPHACAVVYSADGIVKWAKRSRAFRERIPENMRVPEGSHARGFFDRKSIADAERYLAARAWLPTSMKIAPNVEIIEHAMVIPEPGWGGVLSLLWLRGQQ